MARKLARFPEWQLDAELAKATMRVEALVAAYKVAFGKRWPLAGHVKGFVYANHKTCLAIGRKIMDFDRAHPESCMVGGYWLNYGFSDQGPELPDWIVSLPEVES